MKKIVFLFIILLFTNNLFAVDFYIKKYSVDINIKENSILEVEENILTHFYRPRHGIIRFIPYKYNVDTKTENMKNLFIYGDIYSLYIFDIETPGIKNKIYKEGAYLNIRMGDAAKYVEGDVNYTIKYKIYGAISFLKDYSEFYYNVIGTKWNTNIEKASFRIKLPKNYLPAQGKYFVVRGKLGSKEKVPLVRADYGLLYGETTKPLSPYEGVTVGIWFPQGFLKQGSFFFNLKLFFLNNYLYFIPILVFIIFYLLWVKFGKDTKIVKMAQYNPPPGLTPAEVGFIIDDTGDNRDLISLIFYWATQGYIEIEEVEGKTLLDPKQDYILYKKKELPETAKRFEQILFTSLFLDGPVIKISSLKNKFYKTMNMVNKELIKYITDQNTYEPTSIFLSKVGYIATILFLLGGIILAINLKSFVALISLFLCAVISLFFAKYLLKKTDIGTKKYAHIVGFKEFLEKVEKPRLEVLLKEDPNYFDKILPYAIALNLTKKVAEKFKDLVTSPPRWYRGSYRTRYNTLLLAEKIDDSFKTMTNSLTSTPPKSSSGSGFSGGGGSSGGGFGGGGGSAW